MSGTALAPRMGYAEAARIAKKAHKTGKTIREVVLEEGRIPPAELDKLLDLTAMTRCGIR